MDEPISDAARGILDGHIVLDRRLAEKGQFPAINILRSISRVMNQVTTREHREAAGRFRAKLASYLDTEDLLQIGAYKQGTNPQIDEAIRDYPDMLSYLKQMVEEEVTLDTAIERLTTRF
jgi:flagellum-specific ATP synthase